MNTSNSNTSSQIRLIGPIYLYNMLQVDRVLSQDFRHLLIFDFRQNFQLIHIRDAFHVYPGLNRSRANNKLDEIIDVIDLAQKKATEKQTKYKNIQKIRRYFFISNEKLDTNYEGVKYVMKCLQQRKSKEDKFYGLNENFQSFQKKYPFMFLQKSKLQQASKGTKQEFDKALLYPYSKFPSEIILDKLYLGTVYSSNSQKQLNDLGIVSLIDFIDYNIQQKKAQFKDAHQSYLHIPINQQIGVVIDFDIINKQIDQKIQKGKVLLYCKDGQSISPAFAIAYLMYKAKLDVQMATLKVCQAISRVQLNKMVYTQLLVYRPKK